jgi:hypothetical protein
VQSVSGEFLRAGQRVCNRAATPATTGVAMLDPDHAPYVSLGVVEKIASPGATRKLFRQRKSSEQFRTLRLQAGRYPRPEWRMS